MKLATKQLKKHKKVQNLDLNPRDYKNLDDINLGIIIRCRSDLGRICAWQGNHNEAFPTAKNEDFPRADIEITSKLLLVLTRNHKYVSNPKCNPILQMPRTRIKQNSDFFDKVKASKC